MGFITVAGIILGLGLLYALRAVFRVCRETGEHDPLFDRVLISVPTVALSECSRQAEQMMKTAGESLRIALDLFQRYDPEGVKAVQEGKRELDRYEETLSGYLSRIPGCDLSEEEVRERMKLDLTIGNIQSLGACAVKLEKLAAKGKEKEVTLTEADRRDLLVVTEAIMELLQLLVECYRVRGAENDGKIQALQKVINGLLLQLKTSVVVCLKNGTISPDACYILSCVYMDCGDVLEFVQMIQLGMERTGQKWRRQKYAKEKLPHEESDQVVFNQYAIKYSI